MALLAVSLLSLAAVSAQLAVIQGGYANSGTQQQLRVFDPSSRTWSDYSTPTTNAPPANRQYGRSAVWFNNRLWIFGGCYGITGGLGGDLDMTNAMYYYTPATRAWTAVTVGGTGYRPTQRCFQSAVMDTTNNFMLVFGGQIGAWDFDNQVWRFNPATSAWLAFNAGSTSSFPPARCSHSAVWSSSNNRMYVYGGYSHTSGGTVTRYTGLWYLAITNSGANGAWTSVTTTGATVPASDSHCAVYIASSNSMLIYGGGATSANTNAIYEYTIASNRWDQITTTGATRLALRGHTCYYIEDNSESGATKNLYTFGGSTTTEVAGIPSGNARVQHIELITKVVTALPNSPYPGSMYHAGANFAFPVTAAPTTVTAAPTAPTAAPTFPTFAPASTFPPTPSPTAVPTESPALAPVEPSMAPTLPTEAPVPNTNAPTEPNTHAPTAPTTPDATLAPTDAPVSNTHAPTEPDSTHAPTAPDATEAPSENTHAPTPAPSGDSSSGGGFAGTGLTAGAFFGILIGVVLALALIVFCYCRQRQNTSTDEARPFNRL